MNDHPNTLTPPLLSLSRLTINLSSQNIVKPLVKSIDLNLMPGEIVALVGESGCGKSVTAQAIMRLLDPSTYTISGEIHLDQSPLHLMSEKQLQQVRGKQIGMVFQDPATSLNPSIKIGHQICEPLIYHQHLNKKTAKSQAIEMLEHVGISDPVKRFDAYPFQLSGGMRQRVAIAIALAAKPKLLIADEPTTALDVTVQAQILELLKTLCHTLKMGLLFITHDLAVVASLCNKIAIMKEGEIVERGSVDQLFYTPRHPYTKQLLLSGQV